MNWLNIETKTLRSREFIGSTPVERATWLCVLGYAVEQENGGRIVGGAAWKDRQWQQTCGVTLREVRAAKHLLLIEGEDVVVVFYPLDKEATVRLKREQARRGGVAKALANARANGVAFAPAEGKEKEGNASTVPPPSRLTARETPPADGGQAGELQAGDLLGMESEAAFALLKQHFPDRDVWGEYKRLKTLAANEGTKVTWPRLVAWLRKAGSIARLPTRNPERRDQVTRNPTEQPLTLEEQREMAEDFATMRVAAGLRGSG